MYKDMTEHCGPCEHECPPKIFKLLTPLDETNDEDKWAREWRKKVQNLHKIRENIKKIGHCVIKTKEPIRFVSGSSYEYFQKEGRRMYAGYMNGTEFKSCVRVTFKLEHYEYEVV
jgi:hypothetical protein